MRRIAGLDELAASYDGLLCDVWGVLHNGMDAFPAAVDALRRFRREAGPVVLVTNAPRPAVPIREQLRLLRVTDDAYDAIVTSGDVTRALIAQSRGAGVLHLGPDRDISFYDGLDVRRVPAEAAELISCTGLYDDITETPEDYRDMLADLASRGLPMVCANPDIVVERGDRLVYCAGALARLYGELGGRAVLAGKPHAPIYEAARATMAEHGAHRLLAVGDGLPTDIRGAVDNGIDAVFITGGIHAADFGPPLDPDGERIGARLQAEGLSVIAYLPKLVWNGATVEP
jgi:HAD superfamily hydrolase (TIGR01459 family)